jgi:hypothetical protein
MMEAAKTSEKLVNFYRLHGATTQKTAIFNVVPILFISFPTIEQQQKQTTTEQDLGLD